MPEAQIFRARIGAMTPFMVPRTGDTPPTATLTGPTGDHDLEVVEVDDHPTFGPRWQVNMPGPWWAEGVYTIEVSSGETYAVYVGGRRATLSKAELRRLAELPAEEVADVIGTFGPPGVSTGSETSEKFYELKRAMARGEVD